MAKFFLGSTRPDSRGANGWWNLWQAVPLAFAVVATAAVGLWWLSLLALPFSAYWIALTIGGFRERV